MKRLSPLVLLLLVALAAPAPASAARDVYVALGDSYSAGYQRNGPNGAGRYTRNGLPYQLQSLARRDGWKGLRLANFACGGETTVSLLKRTARCKGPGPGGVDYAGKTQMAASEAYLRENREQVAFVTILIGGNDVTNCLKAPDKVACVLANTTKAAKNIEVIGRRVRRAVGPRVPIVAGTYPNVILGIWTSGKPEDQELAKLTIFGFQTIINPNLKKAYAKNRIGFVDVTAATGAYGPLDQLADFPPYGQIPVPVATICEISYFCQYRDIHLKTNGYRQMAELFLRELPRPG